MADLQGSGKPNDLFDVMSWGFVIPAVPMFALMDGIADLLAGVLFRSFLEGFLSGGRLG